MIDYRPYRSRTHDFLHRELRKSMNTLQLRDWEIELHYGNLPPTCLLSQSNKVGACKFWVENLDAIIWINKDGCKDDNQDPLNVLLHEIAHIWLEYEENLERKSNILALLLEKKEKK